MKIDSYVNHIVFVLDKSGSMGHLSDDVVKVFDGQIAHLAKRSKELDQETRVTVFAFDTAFECLVYDKDVLRLPSLRGLYQTGGSTALIDATVQAVDDLRMTPEKYGDHSFLCYVLTDGEENSSKRRQGDLQKMFKDLPDNWTVAVLVPDQAGVHEAKRFGFPVDNIAVWTTTQDGIAEVGRTIRDTTETFMIGRTKGIRGTRNLFKVDSSNLTHKVVTATLQKLNKDDFGIFTVPSDATIRDFVEKRTHFPYVKGCAFYQLTKPEEVQAKKKVAVRNRQTGDVYSGDNARQLLGLPAVSIKVVPADFSAFDVFVQSTSVNRRLIGGTQLLVVR